MAAKPAHLVINNATVKRIANDAAFVGRFPFLRRANTGTPKKSCCGAKKAAQELQGIAVVMRTLAGMPQGEVNTFLTMLNVPSAKVMWSKDGKSIETKIISKT
jgi:hypothetical protein